jgi:hypothetical protein
MVVYGIDWSVLNAASKCVKFVYVICIIVRTMAVNDIDTYK